MDVLKELLAIIDGLDSNPSSVDLSNIRRVIVESYDVVRDGLKRSNYADQFIALKAKFDSLNSQHSILLSESVSLRSEVEKLQPQISSYASFFADSKQKLLGKLQLLKSFSPEYKKTLSKQIEDSLPDSFLFLLSLVENSFTAEWLTFPSASDISAQQRTNFIDFKPFYSGR